MIGRASLLLGATIFGASVAALAQPGTGPVFPPFGFDVTAVDPSTRPGDDFFQYANGKYLERTTIPADRPIASRRFEMTDRTDQQLKTLLEEAAGGVAEQPSDLKGKVGAFYAAFMDEATIDRLGAGAIAPELTAIRAAPDLAGLARLMGESASGLYSSPFSASVDADYKKPGVYALYVSQSGLGLPDRDYYLKSDFAAQREGYRAYAQQLLALSGWADPAGTSQRVLALETALAEASSTKVQQRDPDTQYNPVSKAQLQALAPQYPWAAYLDGAGIGDRDRFIATTNTAFPRLAAVIASAPLDTVKAWMAFHVADNAAPYLSRPFSQARFDFREKVLLGQKEQAPRWKRAKLAVGGGDCGADPASCFGTLDWAVGQLYAERYFPAATKAAITTLVGDVKSAFRHRLQNLGVDESGDAQGSAQETRHLLDQGRLSRHLARLFKRGDSPRRPRRQCPPRGGCGLGVLRQAQPRSGRQERLADDPANQRRLQRLAARHRLPGRHPAGTDVRPQRRPGLQLRQPSAESSGTR